MNEREMRLLEKERGRGVSHVFNPKGPPMTALELADRIMDICKLEYTDNRAVNEAAAMLRSQHAEIEALSKMGAAATRKLAEQNAEIERLRGLLKSANHYLRHLDHGRDDFHDVCSWNECVDKLKFKITAALATQEEGK